MTDEEQRLIDFIALMNRARWRPAEAARRLKMSKATLSNYMGTKRRMDEGKPDPTKDRFPPTRTVDALRRAVTDNEDHEKRSDRNLEKLLTAPGTFTETQPDYDWEAGLIGRLRRIPPAEREQLLHAILAMISAIERKK
jgi:hypothetical protein